MNSKPVLYHTEMSVCAAKVRMAFAEKGVAWEGKLLNLRAGEAQRPDYVALNPNQEVPTLVHQGRPIINPISFANTLMISCRRRRCVRLAPTNARACACG